MSEYPGVAVRRKMNSLRLIFLLYGTTNLEFISFYWVRRFLSPNGGKNKINFLGTTKFEAQGAHFLLLGTTIIEAKWGQWKKHWPHFVIIGYDDF